VGHTGTFALATREPEVSSGIERVKTDASNASGDTPSTSVGENLRGQGASLREESPDCLVQLLAEETSAHCIRFSVKTSDSKA
jgi:hypothetical protein